MLNFDAICLRELSSLFGGFRSDGDGEISGPVESVKVASPGRQNHREVHSSEKRQSVGIPRVGDVPGGRVVNVSAGNANDETIAGDYYGFSKKNDVDKCRNRRNAHDRRTVPV